MSKHYGAVRDARLRKHAAIVADANDLKAGDDYNVGEARRAERDAMEELMGDFDHPDEVEAIELPSERLD